MLRATARPDAGSQRFAILEYARGEGFGIDEFIEATASGRTSAQHRRLDQLMAVLEPGDRLVVGELSRLDGREDRRFPKLEVSKSSIAKITGVTRPTLYNFIASRALNATP